MCVDTDPEMLDLLRKVRDLLKRFPEGIELEPLTTRTVWVATRN
jgi:hypothetical protein